ncbi:MAG: hypothetical protein DRP74_06425 [Candidatus Omnitrophota bacterium]|nr:MAG: hypothetical protein DRP74_06425 [Candidatus Omnitrophota bacterium]
MPVFDYFQELKKEGVFLANMVTYAPYTVASVHALFSGMYGSRNGVDSYYGSLDFDKDNCFTITQYLKENGYYCKADVLSKIILPLQGFDEVLIHDEYADDLKTKHKELINQVAHKNPFFLFLHYSKIHTGIISEVVSKFGDFDQLYFSRREENRQRYDRFVKSAGEYLKGIMEYSKKQGLFENTLFVIFTDHGCSLGEKVGEKCYGVFTYDYTVVTFAYLIYPKLLPMAKVIPVSVRSIDIAPTLLDILSIKKKNKYKDMQGETVLPLIKGKDSRDRDAYIETAGLSGPHPSPYKPNICAYRTSRLKLIYNSSLEKKELYDLEKDPTESVNLIGKCPGLEAELWEKMQQNKGRVFLG